MPADAALTLRAGRQAYLAASGLPADGGYDEKWVRFKVLGIPVAFPNTQARRRQVPIHDAHHVLTGYATDLAGEAEIGAWEIGSACDGPARYLGLLVMGFVLPAAPARLFHAFVRGRGCTNYYESGIDDTLLDRTLGTLRSELGLDVAVGPSNARDRAAFLGWSLLALAMVWGQLAAIALLWWAFQ